MIKKNNLGSLVFLVLSAVGSMAQAQHHYHRRSTVVVEGNAGGLAASSATSATWLSISASTVAAHHKAVEYIRVQEDAVAVVGGGAQISAMLRVVMNEEKQLIASQMGDVAASRATDKELVRLVQIKADALSSDKTVSAAVANLSAVERFAVGVERLELTKQFGADAVKFSDADVLELVEIKGGIAK
jgi:hypothetical protein